MKLQGANNLCLLCWLTFCFLASTTHARLLARPLNQTFTGTTSSSSSNNQKNGHNMKNKNNNNKTNHTTAQTARNHQKEKRNKKKKKNIPQQQQGGGSMMNQQQAQANNKKDCGSFLIRQESGLVIYDDFEEFDLNDAQDLVCDNIGDTEEFCFANAGADSGEAPPLYVQGKCRRGVGTTKITFTTLDYEQPSYLLFACRGSDQAQPKVKCQCEFLDHADDECNPGQAMPFRAEAHFGNLTMPTGIAAECTLACRMPTTNE